METFFHSHKDVDDAQLHKYLVLFLVLFFVFINYHFLDGGRISQSQSVANQPSIVIK